MTATTSTGPLLPSGGLRGVGCEEKNQLPESPNWARSALRFPAAYSTRIPRTARQASDCCWHSCRCGDGGDDDDDDDDWMLTALDA